MIQSIQVSSNPSVFGTFTANLFNNSAGITCLNLTAEQLIDYAKATMVVIVTGKMKKTDPEREIYRGTINICNLAKGSMGNFLSRILSESLIKYSNYAVSCPQLKDTYTIINFPLDIDTYVPSLFFTLVKQWEVTLTTRGKITNNKPLIALFSLKLNGVFA